uniref:Ion transport domain-containing protein n=1 Tax=Haptolina ericina TaxID=156174 RepID=A0A7S3AFJ0_9EUKA
MILANVVVLLIEVELGARQRSPPRYLEDPTTIFFDVCFLGEAGLHLWCFGSHAYLLELRNRYALLVALITFVADSVAWWATPHARDDALRVAQLLRLLRPVRLLFSFRRFDVIIRHFLRVLPSFSGLVGAVWALFAFYAQLGVALFGGLVRLDHWSPSDPAALYAYCNFNDFGSAVLTLFELLVVNNWHDIMRQVVDVTSDWAVVYFISWYVISVVVMFNLVIAHILDGFFDGEQTFDARSGVAVEAEVDTEFVAGRQCLSSQNAFSVASPALASTPTPGPASSSHPLADGGDAPAAEADATEQSTAIGALHGRAASSNELEVSEHNV